MLDTVHGNKCKLFKNVNARNIYSFRHILSNLQKDLNRNEICKQTKLIKNNGCKQMPL